MKVGDKVHYQPAHYGPDEFENGLVKEIPNYPEGSPGHGCIRVVYNCNGEWHRYREYTAALTRLEDLRLGWRS